MPELHFAYNVINGLVICLDTSPASISHRILLKQEKHVTLCGDNNGASRIFKNENNYRKPFDTFANFNGFKTRVLRSLSSFDEFRIACTPKRLSRTYWINK